VNAREGTYDADRARARLERESDVPVLEPTRGGLAERFSQLIGDRHPVVAFLVAVITGYVLLAATSIVVGLFVTELLLDIDGLRRFDERFPAWLEGERTPGLTDASFVGSEISGGKAVVGLLLLIALVMAVLRRWRIGAFIVFAVAVESGTYRATTFLVERRRPDVERLEGLPVDASYPSGHTAASIALYSGIALLLTSRLAHGPWRVAIWVAPLAIPPIVALARLYRGMHHPIDILAGVPIGIAALIVVLFAARVAGAAVAKREARA